MHEIGYAHLVERLTLSTPPLKRVARIMPVAKIHQSGHVLAVPSAVAPAADDLLGHVLFAIKHEGINLCILSQALRCLPANALVANFEDTPSGIYIRKACILWEAFNNATLPTSTQAKGAVTPLFDPRRYLTGQPKRSRRWRIDFNGLGSLRYCATVERTSAINALLANDTLAQAQTFMANLPEAMMERAIA